MKVFSTSLSTKKAASAVNFAYAVKLMTESPLYLTTWDKAIEIEGNTYIASYPLEVGSLTASGGGSDGGSLKLGNVDFALSSLFFAQGFRQKRVTIYEVFPENTIDYETVFIGDVDGQEFSDGWINLTLGPIMAQGVAQSPRRRIVPGCGFVFKSDDCGYSGATTHCPKTFTGCLSGRYAGFRFIPAKGATFSWGSQRYVVK